MNLKRNHLCLVLAVAFLQPTFLAHWTRAETVEWIHQFGSSTSDEASDIATSPTGDVFVAGTTLGDLGGIGLGAEDAFVSKYDSLGNAVWTRQIGTLAYEGDINVAGDALGNVYVSGQTAGSLAAPNDGQPGEYDGFLSKLNASGEVLWTQQFGSFYGVRNVTVDRHGDAIVTGAGARVQNSGGVFAKFSAEGEQLWTQNIFDGVDFQIGNSVATDHDGNIFVAGSSARSALLNKYDADGELLWTRVFQLDEVTWGFGVAADEAGNVYVTGSSEIGEAGFKYDGFLRKYDPFGTLHWSREFGDPNDYDGFRDVAVDDLGNVMVVGATRDPGQIGAGPYYANVVMYDANGELQWTRPFPTDAHDEGTGVATDGVGNFYITGNTYGDLGGPNAGVSDAFLAKIRLNDVVTPGDTNGDGLVDLEDLNNVRNHFGGTGLGDTNADGIVDLEDLNAVRNNFGTTSGSTAVPEPAAGWLFAAGCFCIGFWYLARRAAERKGGCASACRIALAMSMLCPCINAHAQTVEWICHIGSPASDNGEAVAADRFGNVYVAGQTQGDMQGTNQGERDAAVARVDSSGNLLWTRQLGTPALDIAFGLSVDQLGNVYSAGYTEGDLARSNLGRSEIILSKHNTNGELVWLRQYGTGLDHAYDVAATNAGEAYIAGETYGALGGVNGNSPDPLEDAFVSKLDADGNLLWTRQSSRPGVDMNHGIAIDQSNNFYTGGLARLPNRDWATVTSKFDEDGTLIWSRELSLAPTTEGHDIAVDSEGNVYVAGKKGADRGPDGEQFLCRYDALGELTWCKDFEDAASSSQSAEAVATDQFGNVYVGGHFKRDSFDPVQGYVAKYDASGALKWREHFTTASSYSVYPLDIATNGLGDIFLTGETKADLGGPSLGSYDFFLVKIVDDTIVPGDTNGDGVVDLADLNNVRNHFGGTGLGDTNADGIVDLEDLNAVRNHFGAVNSATAVPEPSAVVLLVVGGGLLGVSTCICRAMKKRPNTGS